MISGGGRCNFTDLSANPRPAFSRYSPADLLETVERYGIAWHEKTLGVGAADRPHAAG